MIEGQLSEEGLAALSQNTDMTTQLARELASGIKESVEDLTATFKKMAVKNDRETKKPELKVINPEVFKDIDIRQDTKDFYKNFFNYDLTDEELDTILATEANASSESIY